MKHRTTAADFWAGLGLMVLGAVLLYGSLQIFVPPVLSDMLGPRAFPLGLSAGLLVTGAAIAVRVLLHGGEPADSGPPIVLVTVIVAVIVYGLAFRALGYLTATTLFLAFLFYYLGERRHWLTALVSLGVTLALTAGFGGGLHVQLPKGPLGF